MYEEGKKPVKLKPATPLRKRLHPNKDQVRGMLNFVPVCKKIPIRSFKIQIVKNSVESIQVLQMYTVYITVLSI